MYWKEYRNLSLFGLFAIIFLFGSCSSDNKDNSINVDATKSKKESNLTPKQQIIREVESELSINAKEKVDIQVLFKNLNDDTLKDAVVLVNRKEFCYQEMKKSNRMHFFTTVGHTAQYNYVFVKIGGRKGLVSANPVSVGSNVDYPLKATFLQLTSPTNTDFFVSYRIRNSLHRNYYALRGNKLYLVFSCPIFDDIGDKDPAVYVPEPKISPIRIPKDIALYKGKIVDYKLGEIKDLYHYEPKGIISTDSLVGYFILNEKTMKYVTPMKPVKED